MYFCMMDEILPMDVRMVKIEYEETEEGQELQGEYLEIHTLQNEYEVKQENEIENGEPDLTDEELEPPVPVTLPDHGTVILKEEVLQDPLVDIPDSWICINDESYLQDYNALEPSRCPSFFHQSSERSENMHEMKYVEESELTIFSQESLEGDPLHIVSQQQWIEEAKQKVELHIQEVRRCRKLRGSNVRRDVKTEVVHTKNKDSKMIVIVPQLHQMTDVPVVHVPQQTSHHVTVTETSSATTSPKHVLQPRPRPQVTYGSEWDQWVREEKARLEQHILDVRESRKRKLEETRIRRRKNLHNRTIPQEPSLPIKHGSNKQSREKLSSESTKKIELRVISKGRGRGVGKPGRSTKRINRREKS